MISSGDDGIVVGATSRCCDFGMREVHETTRHLDQKLDFRFDGLDRKVDSRFDALDRKVDSRFDALDQKWTLRFDGLDQKLSTHFRWTVGLQVLTLVAVLGALLPR